MKFFFLLENWFELWKILILVQILYLFQVVAQQINTVHGMLEFFFLDFDKCKFYPIEM